MSSIGYNTGGVGLQGMVRQTSFQVTACRRIARVLKGRYADHVDAIEPRNDRCSCGGSSFWLPFAVPVSIAGSSLLYFPLLGLYVVLGFLDFPAMAAAMGVGRKGLCFFLAAQRLVGASFGSGSGTAASASVKTFIF